MCMSLVSRGYVCMCLVSRRRSRRRSGVGDDGGDDDLIVDGVVNVAVEDGDVANVVGELNTPWRRNVLDGSDDVITEEVGDLASDGLSNGAIVGVEFFGDVLFGGSGQVKVCEFERLVEVVENCSRVLEEARRIHACAYGQNTEDDFLGDDEIEVLAKVVEPMDVEEECFRDGSGAEGVWILLPVRDEGDEGRGVHPECFPWGCDDVDDDIMILLLLLLSGGSNGMLEPGLRALEGEGTIIEFFGELALLVVDAMFTDNRSDESEARVGGVDSHEVDAFQEKLDAFADPLCC